MVLSFWRQAIECGGNETREILDNKGVTAETVFKTQFGSL